MERNNSYGASWADQWDYSNPDPLPENKKSSGSGGTTKKKVGEGLEKTKAVATTGVKKVKEGATLGFQWVKDKYNKRTQKH